MASYRFCRTDDIALLVRAYEECFRVHFPELQALSAERFRRLAREIDLWCGSCLVAAEGDEPIGVLLAAKRPREALAWCVGVRPDRRGRGHGRHLVSSLCSKLAILGPPRLVAEVPEAWADAGRFLERCGFLRETEYLDFAGPAADEPPAGAELVVAVGVDELEAAGALRVPGRRSWERTPETLVGRAADLRALAVAGGERIEAWLTADRDEADGCRVVGLGCPDPARAGTWLGLLARVASRGRPVRVPQVHRDEVAYEALVAAGFRPGATTIGYARPAVAPRTDPPGSAPAR